MQRTRSIHSVEDLMAQPQVNAAEVLEFTFDDLVHFRISTPQDVFALVEQRLRLRSAATFAGYAAARGAMEAARRGAGLGEKIDSCCVHRTDWLPFRQMLQSIELETWMDLSHPTAFGLRIYQAALAAGKAVRVPREGLFHPLFLQLLLEKNGYELTLGEAPPGSAVKVHVGPPVSARAAAISLVSPDWPQRRHPLERDACLASRLAAGILHKDLDDQSARGGSDSARHVCHLGYRLTGPALVVFWQALREHPHPVSPHGAGAEWLLSLGQELQRLWPWLPPVVGDSGGDRIGLLPDAECSLSLLPPANGSSPKGPSVFDLARCTPQSLVLLPLTRFLEAVLAGPAAQELTAAAAAFARDYALATRGFHLPLPVDPVLEAWREELLNPDPGFLAWVSGQAILPGLTRPRMPWRARALLTSGPWPSGSYRLAEGIDRAWARWLAPDAVRLIEAGLAGDWQAG